MNNDFFDPGDNDFFNDGFDLSKHRNDLSDFLNKQESEKEDLDVDDLSGSGYCEVYDSVMKAALMSKPFGIIWDEENIKEFLKKVGYKIIERVDEETGETYSVPIKPDTEFIPEKRNELRRVFDEEIQKVLLKFLLKLIDS